MLTMLWSLMSNNAAEMLGLAIICGFILGMTLALTSCATPQREWNDRNLYDALKRAGYEDYQGVR